MDLIYRSRNIFVLHKKWYNTIRFNILSLTALCRSNSNSNLKLVEEKVVIILITLMFKLITLILVYIKYLNSTFHKSKTNKMNWRLLTNNWGGISFFLFKVVLEYNEKQKIPFCRNIYKIQSMLIERFKLYTVAYTYMTG